MSKLESPEFDVYNEYVPKLQASKYGSREYYKCLEGMGTALAHHCEHNRHHPEHWPDGVDSMTLVDVIEMLADWKAAVERRDDGDPAEVERPVKRDLFH